MVSRTVDLRSDTVTKPTEAMRAAMANAEVDDDVLGSDPTAFRLETEVAKISGKEAALFVPSGTMANLIGVLTHCRIRGSEIILGDSSHIHIYENGGISTVGGVHPKTVKNNEDGTMDIDLIEASIRDPRLEICYPTTRLICLENSNAQHLEFLSVGLFKLQTQFRSALSYLLCLFPLLSEFEKQICLSKGVGAPVGSMIVGSKSFIARAKILRKTLGGGMRQVGVLCAAAYIALKENVGKLEGDRRRAKTLAEELNKIKVLKVNISSVETNIVYFDILEDANVTETKLCQILEEHGVLALPEGPQRIRLVIHHQISDSDVQYTLSCIQQAISGIPDENGNK